MIITLKEWDQILFWFSQGYSHCIINIDFGERKVKARFEKDYVFLGKNRISLKKKIKPNFCYLAKNDDLLPVAFFSQETNTFYRLIPTIDWPSVSIGSVPMHRIKHSSPLKDAQEKVDILRPRGIVLDTCGGLGYTAIISSRRADKVYTFEKDKNILFLARLNPVSQPLFSQDNIILANKDVAKAISEFPGGFFDCVLHDPPTYKLAPQLFSLDFYRQLHRVLKKRGRLLHYVPLPQRSKGKDFSKIVRDRLSQVSFRIIKSDPQTQVFLCSP